MEPPPGLHLDDASTSGRTDRAEIADLHQRIGFALKVAEIHALPAIVGPAGSWVLGYLSRGSFSGLPDLAADREVRNCRESGASVGR